jgi:hypothetical protein
MHSLQVAAPVACRAILLFALSVGTAVAVTGASGGFSRAYGASILTKECATHYKRWQARATHKAFAVSRPASGRQACGFSWKASSKKSATAVALDRCRRFAARGKISRPQCQVIAAR